MEQGDAYHYKYFGGVVSRVEGSNKVLVMNSPSTGALHLIIKTAQLSKHDYSPAMRTGQVRRSGVELSVNSSEMVLDTDFPSTALQSAAEVTIWHSDTMCVYMTPAGVTWSLPTAATLALQVRNRVNPSKKNRETVY